MTNNKDTEDKTTKKLTFSGTRLTLGKSLHPKTLSRVVGSSGSTVVVEVKRGKAVSHGLDIKEGKAENISEDYSQVNRRLSILQKARDDDDKLENTKISTLSRIVEMNQALPIQEDNSVKDTLLEPVVSIEKTDVISRPAKPKTIEEEDEELEKQKLEDAKSLVKQKAVEVKKIKKSDIFHMLSEDSGDVPFKTRSLASIQRAKAKQRRKTDTSDNKKQDKVYREVIVPEVITVAELANRMTERVADVVRELMRLGVMATANQSVDADTAELIVNSFGHSAKRIQESDVENILNNEDDKIEDLESRAPIVTVMGHVDHGKTSLLDALKSTDIAGGESGGITQHIGAYTVTMSDNRMITFIDTPGHEAFTEMRTRGAKVTDIVVLVVAADDGIKAQTVEAISHAKAAGVPIIVAINKIDKPDANIEKVKNELLQYELISEDLGGDVVIIPVSAKEKTNLDKLEEAILLVAEIEDLKANPNTSASGVVIESRIHKAEGVIISILVQRGTLKNGDLIVAGSSYGRIKKMNNDKGKSVQAARPSYVVEIFDLNDAPSAGDLFNVVATEKQARDITEYRIRKSKENRVTASKTSLEELFQKASGDGKIKELPIIIKGDVYGSIEAINGSLAKIISDEVKLKIIHQAVGGITESDVTLSKATGAIILGFNVRPNAAAAMDAQKNKIDIRYYSIIYNLIDDIKFIMSGMLSPIIREIYIGSVEIREVFNVSKVGKIAGSYVTKGVIKRGAGVRLLREDIVIHEGKLKTLKRFKEDVKDVREGYECGIAFENYDNIKIGDLVEVFEIVEEQKQL